MSNFTMRDLLEAGVHYGHQTRRWNPKMKPYIFGARNGIHVIDLQKTVQLLKQASSFVEDLVARGGHVLFVGTKRICRDVISEEAKRAGMYYINYRWLGGTLTNYGTIRQSIHRLKKLEKMSQDGTFDKLTKKESLGLRHEIEKLEKYLGGIKDMPSLPKAVFIIDSHKEAIAVQECVKSKIPIVAVIDTNGDPSSINYPIPGNDDSFRSLDLFIKAIADACVAGKARAKDFVPDKDEKNFSEDRVIVDDDGNEVSVTKA